MEEKEKKRKMTKRKERVSENWRIERKRKKKGLEVIAWQEQQGGSETNQR